MKTYIVTTKHDNGEATFHIRAESMQQAKLIVMDLEKCPERAIVSIWVRPSKKLIKQAKAWGY